MTLSAAAVAAASPYSRVPSALDEGDPIDLHASIDYEFTWARSQIRREQLVAALPTDPIPAVRDLVAKSSQHVIIPRFELGVFRDLWLAVAMPYVVASQGRLELDQGVTAASSSTVMGGLLPASGYDADAPGAPAEGALFRGTRRHGWSQVHLGLGWAPMNQQRDPTKPTWKLGVEARLAMGKMARFDRENPDNATGVSNGVHELRFWTSVAKDVGWAEPFVEFSFQMPVSVRERSPFSSPGFSANHTNLQPQAYAHFGFESVWIKRATDHTRMGIEVSSRVTAFFEGRAQTPMWEVFSYAGDPRYLGPLVLDASPTTDGLQPLRHPGVSNVENHLTMSGRVALAGRAGKHIHFSVFGEFATGTDRHLTYADAGSDLPTCGAGQSAGCEAEDNHLVNGGTSEVNPLHLPILDMAGHRYRQKDPFTLVAGVELLGTF
jgi:hypothetical protein